MALLINTELGCKSLNLGLFAEKRILLIGLAFEGTFFKFLFFRPVSFFSLFSILRNHIITYKLRLLSALAARVIWFLLLFHNFIFLCRIVCYYLMNKVH